MPANGIANGHIEIFYRHPEEFNRPGWYWIAYSNPKRQLVYEGGPFKTELEAELDLAEYLRK